VNERIRCPEILLIDENGEKKGKVSPREGLQLAKERGLDLVEIAPQARPPVCRILDYSKWQYEQAKKERLQQRKQRAARLKEVQMHVLIGQHDFQTKIKHVEEFLAAGHKVKIMIFFKGREVTHFEIGRQLVEKVKEQLAEKCEVEHEKRTGDKRIELYLKPTVPKTHQSGKNHLPDEEKEQRDAKDKDSLRRQEEI